MLRTILEIRFPGDTVFSLRAHADRRILLKAGVVAIHEGWSPYTRACGIQTLHVYSRGVAIGISTAFPGHKESAIRQSRHRRVLLLVGGFGIDKALVRERISGRVVQPAEDPGDVTNSLPGPDDGRLAASQTGHGRSPLVTQGGRIGLEFPAYQLTAAIEPLAEYTTVVTINAVASYTTTAPLGDTATLERR